MEEHFKKNIIRFYVEKSEDTFGYIYVIAVDEDGREYVVHGDYCGGIPVSSWHPFNRTSTQPTPRTS